MVVERVDPPESMTRLGLTKVRVRESSLSETNALILILYEAGVICEAVHVY